MDAFSLSFEPLLPVIVLLALALPALALVAYALYTKSRGAGLRLLAFLALTLALANPVLLREERLAEPTTVALIVDESQSQRIGDRSETTQTVVNDLREKFERFGQFDLRVASVGVGENANENTSTQLFSALRSTLRDVPPARVGGAIMVTDGQVHDVPDSLSDLGFEAPVHGLITGQDNEVDRRMELVQAPRFSIVGQSLTINYRILEDGADSATGEPLQVDVFRNGDLITTETASVGDTFPIMLELDRAGKNIIELVVEPREGELTENNNRAVVRVEGIRENLRVLLVSGEPHSGERTWRNLLKSDASVDLVHFTILRPPEKQDGTPINELSLIAFPTRELFVEKIEDFDLIIFDRYQNRNVLPLLYYDYITQYVRNGGALLIAAGPEYAGSQSIAQTPLVNALPALPTGTIEKVGFKPGISADGRKHPVTRDLEGGAGDDPNWGRWFHSIDVGETDGTIVMQGATEKPLLILERFGEGRVGLMLSDHGWLWARGFEGGGPHVSLYRRTAHWLMREPDLEEETLTAEGDGQSLVITRQTMADEVGELTITTPSGQIDSLSLSPVLPGRFEARYETDEIGLFTVTNDELKTLASVGPVDAIEFRNMISTTGVLGDLTRDSGGSARRVAANDIPNIVPVRNASSANGRDWIGLKTTRETRLVGVDRYGLLSGFLGLALLLLILSSMWYREGR